MSSRYPQVLCILMGFRRYKALRVAKNALTPRRRRVVRVNDAAISAADLAPIRNRPRRRGRAIFINSKPSRGLRDGGESPLSGAAAFYRAMGIVMGGLFDNRGAGHYAP
jgi:hypothetical protein